MVTFIYRELGEKVASSFKNKSTHIAYFCLDTLGVYRHLLADLVALSGLGILCSAVGQSLFIYGARLTDSRTSTLIVSNGIQF